MLRSARYSWLVVGISWLSATAIGQMEVDVLVHGATPAGLAAAVSAARDGARVHVVETTNHVGGLLTNGLSHPDFRTYEGLHGAFHEFCRRVEAHYIAAYGTDSPQVMTCRRGTNAEPHVNERIFLQWLAEFPNIQVHYGFALENVQLETEDPLARRITRVSYGKLDAEALEVTPRIVIDASYEGDLMAASGVPYRVGREGRHEFGESLAPDEPDDQLQAYNFRLVMTKNPAIRVEVERPAEYTRDAFAPILPMLGTSIERVFGDPSKCVFKAHEPPLPNDKYDINDVSGGTVRLSLPGLNRGWPEGTPEERTRTFKAHQADQVGLLWFLQNDPEVPDRFREEARAWGFCRDEFEDNDHLPRQLYVREARRMMGRYVFTQKDTDHAPNDARAVFQPNAVAMADYGPNCHGTAHEGPRIGGRHTGEFYKAVPPYQIPYGVLLPVEVANLLVPGACSASHVGFCALRLEPCWMSLGQASGVAARLALQRGAELSKLPTADIRTALHEEGAATIYVSDVPPGNPLFLAVQWLGSLGGLHGLASRGPDDPIRGPNIEGQYYKAFPGQAFEPDRPAEPTLIDRWLELLTAEPRVGARDRLAEFKNPTRGQVAQALHDSAR